MENINFLSFIARKARCFQMTQPPLVTEYMNCRAKLPPDVNLLKGTSDRKVNIPGGSVGKESICSVGNGGSIPGSGIAS